jgi:hypothetical protein
MMKQMYVYVLVSWMNPNEDTWVEGVFLTKELAETYIEEQKLNRKYCDIAGFIVKGTETL